MMAASAVTAETSDSMIQSSITYEPSMRSGVGKLAKQLESYDLLKAIGKGSFGNVFVARKKELGCLVAIKSVNMWKENQKDMKRITHAELNCLEKITASGKRGFVTVVETFGDQYNRYFVFPYLCRGTLWTCSYRTRGKLPKTFVRMIAAEMVDGLDFLHNKLHIVHCDLKEDNVLIDEHGHAVISDFGLAISFKDDEPETYDCEGSACGTHGYIAPEVLDRGIYSYPVDCWALGCILYSVLVGHLPFDADEFEEVKRLTLLAQIEFPDGCGLDYGTKHFLTQLLDKSPGMRLTMEEAKETAYLEEIDWDRVAARDYDVSHYMRLSRERTVPLDTSIGKEVLVDRRKVSVSYSPDEEDEQFETTFDEAALRTCNPGQPTFMPDRENNAEKLFHREPFYFGKRDEKEDEDEESEDGDDLARYSFSRSSCGSSMFVPGADVSPSSLPTDKDSAGSDEPIALPSRFEPVDRQETSYSSLDLPSASNDTILPVDDILLDNMVFIYPPMPSIPLLSAPNSDSDCPPRPLPLLARRGLGALKIPSLIWTESCSVTPMSSLPCTPQHSQYAIQTTTQLGSAGKKRRLSNDDEEDSAVDEPPKKRVKAKTTMRNEASERKNEKRKRSLGENLRNILQNLSPTRLVHFSWGH